ncbi:MAG: Poly(3-hydroxybutyrate) depolymerase-like protein, partial [Caulobacteraceae bacterium]|nr:Poly(3-hydroxybutyrate) depolymerase-like protein [Caulobacteraceae bacterium]
MRLLLWTRLAAQKLGRPLERLASCAAALALIVAALALPHPAQAADAPSLKRNVISVGGGMAGQNRAYSYYASSKANRQGYNFLVYALHDNGQTAEQFAATSGWIKVAEDNGFVVIFPEAQDKTWSPFSSDENAYLKAVYDHASTHLTADAPGQADNRPARPAPAEPLNRGVAGDEPAAALRRPAGPVRYGTWQPWQYMTGAGAGGRVAQEFAMDNPGLITAVATLDGVAYDAAFAKGDETAQGYFENQRGGKMVVPAWRPLKKDVPVPAWLFTTGAPTAAEMRLADYWKHANAVSGSPATRTIGGFTASVYANSTNPVEQVRVTTVPAGARYDEAMASAIWAQFFGHTARWTSSPNGEVGAMMTEPEVNKAFEIHTTTVGDRTYKYYVKTPSTYRKGQSLPLVLSLHGAGYPAWMYLSQVRWHEVGEKEGFVTVYLNGQQNRWDFTKPEAEDAKAIEKVINEVAAEYGVDRTRTYLQGFSFGSGMTFVEGITHPKLFAAISPNSGIGDFTPDIQAWVADLKTKGDVRMPTMVVYGSVDGASSTDGLIPAEGVLRNSINLLKNYNNIKTADKIARFNSPYTAAYDVLTPGGKASVTKPNAQYKAMAFNR